MRRKEFVYFSSFNDSSSISPCLLSETFTGVVAATNYNSIRSPLQAQETITVSLIGKFMIAVVTPRMS